MRRYAFLRKYFAKFLVALTLIGLIVYTVFHAIGGSSEGLMTTPARRITDTEILGGNAVLFREETLICTDSGGLVDDLVKSGEKVGKDVGLVRVWTDYSDEVLESHQKQLDRLNRLISVLERGSVSPGEPAINAQRYQKEAEACRLRIKQAMAAGNLELVAKLEDEMLINLCRAATLQGNDETTAQTLAELRAQKTQLQNGACIEVANTYSSGYFYNRSFVDGGEEIFTAEALSSLTANGLDDLRQQYLTASKDGPFAVGKMVYRYDWHLAVVYDTAVDSLLTVGDTYTVTFPENGDMELTLVCERVAVDADGKSVVILKCNDTPSDFEYLRIQRVEIKVGQCKGYYIPEQALVEQNGVDGVYVFENSTVYFRRVEILYRGDGYYIVAEQEDRGDDYLSLNDIIVTAGKNLYDGRVYR